MNVHIVDWTIVNNWSYNYHIKYNLQEPTIAKKLIAKIREEINELKDNPTIFHPKFLLTFAKTSHFSLKERLKKNRIYIV